MSEMSEETEFKTKEQLEEWLREDRKVHPRMATTAADLLFPDFFLPSTLLGQSSNSLREVGLSVPVAQHMSAKLERQQQRENSVTGPAPAQDHDLSLSILTSWCTLPEVPPIGELPNVVQAALTSPLPSHHSTGAHDRPEADVVNNTHGCLTPLSPELGRLRDSIYTLPRIGDNEDSVHSLVDDLILRPMRFLGHQMNCNFRFNRNGSDATGATIKNLRPDVLLWLPSGVLAFKGEDKASEADFNSARNELLSKLNCFTDAFFGKVPYQICYAAGGSFLEFVAIDRNAPGGRPTVKSLAPQLNLDTIKGRSLCVRYAVNITRVLASLQTKYPDGSVARLGETVETDNSVVTILGDSVIKKTKVFTDADTLTQLYTQLRRSQVNGLCSPLAELKISRSVLTARIGPVGFCGKLPTSTIETKAAGRRLLGALQWLHMHGWVHRDVRAANVMFADGNWYLMDLEWANIVDSPIGEYDPNPDQIPPEVGLVEDGTWTTACDMWQFGKVLLLWNHLDEDGLRYANTQLDADPFRRLSATDSLTHAFFAVAD